MVTAMDVSIGHILDALKELNIEEDTLVVFTSDNGPEVQGKFSLFNSFPISGLILF